MESRGRSRPKFGVDAMLGKLARYLRILGYDTLYWKEADDSEILERLKEEERILITRDRRLCEDAIDEGLSVVCFPVNLPLKNLLSCLRSAGLISLSFDPEKSRCPLCNGELIRTTKPPISYGTKKREYFLCKNCGMIYWVGKHLYYIRKVLGEADAENC